MTIFRRMSQRSVSNYVMGKVELRASGQQACHDIWLVNHYSLHKSRIAKAIQLIYGYAWMLQ